MLIVRDRSGNGKGVGFVYRAQLVGFFNGVTGPGISPGVSVLGEFNAALSGSFVGRLVLVRSYDNGTTWSPLTALGTSFDFTGPCQELFEESEPGVLYAWQCLEYTSGTINYRISQ